MVKTSPPEFRQIEIALEKSYRLSPFKLLIFLFWGLILAKCCIVQWLIYNYGAPIDGFLYVWMPSIIFGVMCSVIYAKVSFEEFQRAPMTSRLMRGIWGACAVSMIILGTVAITIKGYSPYILPGLFAILMGTGYYIHSYLDNRKIFKVAAVGWWASSVGLFYTTNSESLAWLSVCILLFQSLPTAILYTEAIKQSKKIAAQSIALRS